MKARIVRKDTPMQPPPIRRKRTIEVFGSIYGSLYNDEVVSSTDIPGRYLRWKWSNPGVVVIPRCNDLIALIPTYRYPIGAVSWELPRGGRDPDESVEEAAIRELLEETGLVAASTTQLGAIYPDTGLIESAVSVVEARVNSSKAVKEQATEAMESVASAEWFTLAELRSAFADQRVQCAITIAAVTLISGSES
jgi:8-oxo-dGTP pyrophosphatase MutT (NUDIX family)